MGVEEKMDKILSELQNTNERIGNMETSQKVISLQMKNLETSKKELSNGLEEITLGQREVTSRMENLEIGQSKLLMGQEEMTSRMGNLEIGQEEMTSRMGNLETGQEEMTSRIGNLETGQGELTSRMGNLETGQSELTIRLEKGNEELKAGQAEIKDIIKHTTTLLTENFTYIRKDMSTFQSDVYADIVLLFNEVASVKRKVDKLYNPIGKDNKAGIFFRYWINSR
jgi:chromosome segregation ATPase